MVLAIMRHVAPEECLQVALDPDRDLNTPMAPELGLFLVRHRDKQHIETACHSTCAVTAL